MKGTNSDLQSILEVPSEIGDEVEHSVHSPTFRFVASGKISGANVLVMGLREQNKFE